MRSGASVVVALLVAVGIPASARAQSGAACNLPSASGVSEQVVTSGGRPRPYRLFVPPGYDGRTTLPLVFDLHGSGGDSAGQARTSGLETLAAREGFAVATLDAVDARWNVPVRDDRPSDVAYASDVIDHVAARVCLDLARVYSTGFSGGARMTSLLACRLGARLAAAAPVAGLRWPAPCEGRAVPVLTFHGLADRQNTYEGGIEGREGQWIESVPDALAGWLGGPQRLRRRADRRGSGGPAVHPTLRGVRRRRRSAPDSHRRPRAYVAAERGRRHRGDVAVLPEPPAHAVTPTRDPRRTPAPV